MEGETEAIASNVDVDEDTQAFILCKLQRRQHSFDGSEFDLDFLVKDLERELAQLDEKKEAYLAHQAELETPPEDKKDVHAELEAEEKRLREVLAEDVQLDTDIGMNMKFHQLFISH